MSQLRKTAKAILPWPGHAPCP